MAVLPPNEVVRVALEIAGHVPRYAYDKILDRTPEAADEIARRGQDIDLRSTVEQLCGAIRDGHYTLTRGCEGGEYGDDWYEDGETLYDDDHLGPELERCFRAAMDCVKQARYAEAIQALDALFAIEVEIEDYDVAPVETLFEHGFINLDYEETLRQYAYAVMMHCRDRERLSRLFEIEQLHRYSLTLREIEDAGSAPIPERDVFASQWVQYLLERDLTRYQALIIDAVMCQGGTEALDAFVLAHGAKYPKAYIHLLELYLPARRFDDAVRVIEDGLAHIGGIDPYRVKMADMLSKIGRMTDDGALYKRGVEEAFHASFDIQHALPLFELRDEAVLARAMRHLDREREAQTDKHHPLDYYYIHFLHGDYDLVWATCRKDDQALGWSHSVKGKMMPLFVALLAGANNAGRCAKAFLQDQFSAPYCYGEGADERAHQAFESFAAALFASFRPLSLETRAQYQRWCIDEAEARAQAVIGGQYRGSYHKVSALVVGLAEAMLAQGNACGAAKFVAGFKEKYPRHTAFHRCLREDIVLSALNVSL